MRQINDGVMDPEGKVPDAGGHDLGNRGNRDPRSIVCPPVPRRPCPGDVMPILLGAHMSIAGGFDKAVERAHAAGCQCVQIFLKNNSQSRPAEIENGDVERFQASLTEHRIAHPLAHASLPDQPGESRGGIVAQVHRRTGRRNAPPSGFPSLIWSSTRALASATEAVGVANVVRALNRSTDRRTV